MARPNTQQIIVEALAEAGDWVKVEFGVDSLRDRVARLYQERTGTNDGAPTPSEFRHALLWLVRAKVIESKQGELDMLYRARP